jgi:flagellar protein FlbD
LRHFSRSAHWKGPELVFISFRQLPIEAFKQTYLLMELLRMIALTRLNGNLLIINGDLIKFVEPAPDTLLTLVTGEKIVVSESCDEVVELALRWRVRILQAASQEMGPLLATQAATNAITARTAADIFQNNDKSSSK